MSGDLRDSALTVLAVSLLFWVNALGAHALVN